MDSALASRIDARLRFVYGPETAASLLPRVLALAERWKPRIAPRRVGWDASDALLITYGDSILPAGGSGATPLAALRDFLDSRVGDLLSFVHLLPFYPYTSDDGFAVEDFRRVRPDLGGWDDIAALAERRRVVFDGVVNHVSASSAYLKGYLAGDPRYADFFIDLPPDTDTRSVLRTRNLPLLHDYPAADGSTRWLWTTFSRDQPDLNFHNPEVLLEILDVLLGYAARGASMIRLDAIPYLWKQLGTSCAHLPQTHELIRLFRDVLDAAAPHVLLLSETNVPHQENIAYFGDAGDEAQMIYNFALAPLIVHSLHTGDGTVLSDWASGIRWIGPRATYLNITATHDGIGMRPTEGLLDEPSRKALMELSFARGGDVTGKRNSDGSISPYELNLGYFDAVNDPGGTDSLSVQVDRFLVSQAIPMCLMGMPGLYIHSLVGSRNDYEGVKRTGRARSINREQLRAEDLARDLDDPSTLRARVFGGIARLLRLRAAQPAFHPDASQSIPRAGKELFAVRRESACGQILFALHNLAGNPAAFTPQAHDGPARWRDLLDREEGEGAVPIAPYQIRWITRR
jgi:glycosidase